jgi:predicted DNA-binding transcriptional regulator AlpA
MPASAVEPDPDQLLNVRQVAQLLCVSVWTVWMMARSGQLRPLTVHKGATRWRRKDVVACIEKLAQQAQEAVDA